MKTKIKIIILALLFYYVSLQAQGVPYNQEFQVNTYTENDQQEVSVSGLIYGGFVACWQSYGQDGSADGIFAQIFNSNGSQRGSEFSINSFTNSYQDHPSVSNLLDGGFVVCWQSWNQGADAYDIFCQLFDSTGNKRIEEFRVNTYTDGLQLNPNVNQLADGRFVISWESKAQDSNDYRFYCQLFNNDGSRYGEEIMVLKTDNDNDIAFPSISGLSNGNFVVCWRGYKQNGSDYGINGQIFNEDGSKQNSEFKVNTNTEIYVFSYPSVIGLSEGKFIVCWTSHRKDIYGQLFYSNGSKVGSEFQINSYTMNDQLNPHVSHLNDGRFVVCWESRGQDNSGYGVYGKYYFEKLIHPLNSFVLLEPPYDMTLSIVNPTFKWQNSSYLRINLPWELEYKIYLDYDKDFNNPRVISQIYDTTCVVDSLTPGTTYFWKVLAKNIESDSLWSSETFGFFVDWNATAIEDIKVNRPQEFKLHQNHPNPFNPNTTITFYLTRTEHVTIEIFNSLGQKVDCLIDANMPQGHHQATYTAKNISSGIYYYKMKTSNFTKIKKMLLIK